MKLFRNTILAVLGLAVAGFATSCSEDHKYYPGEQSPGAYFENTLPTSYNASEANGVIYVQMDRTSADTQSSFDLVMEDPSGLFTAPGSVTFEGANLTTQIPISFAPGSLVEGKEYPVKLTVKDASQYGSAEYSFVISIPDPMVTKKFGSGVYVFNGCWSGQQRGLPATITYNEKNPDVVTMTIGVKGSEDYGWGVYAGQLNVVFQDFNHPDADGNVYCTVPEQFVFTDDEGDVMVSDIGAFMATVGYDPADYAKECYFNVNTGLLTLHNAYYLRGTTRWYGDKCIEYYQLDGYPDYSVSIDYRGALLAPDGSLQALAVFNTNATDVAALKAVCVPGTDAQTALYAILGGADGVVDVPTGENVEQAFPLSGGGDYIIMGVTYDAAGTPQELDYVQFNVNVGTSDDGNWTDVGTADFADGWITAAFSRGGVPIVVEDEMFPVAIQQNQDDATLYRMVQPYGANFPIAANNAYPAKRNIEFTIDGKDYVCFMPQLSGFGTSNWKGELTIGNYTGFVREQNPEASNAAIANYIASKNNEKLLSYFEDNIITVNMPMFGAPGIGDGTFGYNWKTIQPALLIMPEADAPARAKAKAARIANPTFRGIAARAVTGGLQQRVAIQRNLNNVPALSLRK